MLTYLLLRAIKLSDRIRKREKEARREWKIQRDQMEFNNKKIYLSFKWEGESEEG